MSDTWFVNQGRNYEAERDAGLIWAPKQTANGAERFFWSNLKKLKPGDIIIHYYLGIRSISQVIDFYTETAKPEGLEKSADEGFQVKCDYIELEKIIQLTDFVDDILKYGREEKSPFNAKGSVKQGYLFELNETLASIFIKEAVSQKPDIEQVPFIEEFLKRDFDLTPVDPGQKSAKGKETSGAGEVMTNQMLSNLERLMALHESTQLVKPQKKIELPKLIVKRRAEIEAENAAKVNAAAELADKNLRKILEDGAVDEDEVYEMRFRDYSETTFGLNTPLLMRAKALTFDDSPKYFKEPVIIRGEKFYLCSDWNEIQSDKLQQWLEKMEDKLNAIPEYKDIKIRDLAKTVLRDILVEGKVTPEEVEQMLTLEYSEETFGINYPLLVTERNSSNVANYFKIKVPIHGYIYYLCSQWFEQPKNNDRPLLEKWIRTHRDMEPIVVEYEDAEDEAESAAVDEGVSEKVKTSAPSFDLDAIFDDDGLLAAAAEYDNSSTADKSEDTDEAAVNEATAENDSVKAEDSNEDSDEITVPDHISAFGDDPLFDDD